MTTLVPLREVQRASGLTSRHIARMRRKLGTRPCPEGRRERNGRVQQVCPIDKLPVAWQKSLLEESPAIAPAAVERSAHATAEFRYRVIQPLLDNSTAAKVREAAAEQGIPERTLWRWISDYRQRGYNALAGKKRRDAGERRALTPEAIAWLRDSIREDGTAQLSAAELHRAYCEHVRWTKHRLARGESAGPLFPPVSRRTIYDWYSKDTSRSAKRLAQLGLKAFSDTEEPVSYRDYDSIGLLEYVVMDHRMLDIWSLVEDRKRGWRLIRPWVTAALDMRSRRWLAWTIIEVPSSDSIATVLKRVILDHGVPANVYWDNGKDFRCEWFEGPHQHHRRAPRIDGMRPAVGGVLGSLGIGVTHALPFRARSKNIEANFGRLSRMDRSLPVWCGNKPTARPDRFDRELLKAHRAWMESESPKRVFPTIDEVRDVYDEFFTELNHRPIDGPGMAAATPRGMEDVSPLAKWAELAPATKFTAADPQQVQFAFLRPLPRLITVEQSAISVKFGVKRFHYRLRGDTLGLMSLNGRQVEVRTDALDLETVAVYLDDGSQNRPFIGLADNAELRGMGTEDFLAEERERAAGRRMVRDHLERLPDLDDPYVGAVERSRRRSEMRGDTRRPPVHEVTLAQAMPLPVEVQRVAAAAVGDDGDDDGSFDQWGDVR